MFKDLSASFKRLYKSILNNKEMFESGKLFILNNLSYLYI